MRRAAWFKPAYALWIPAAVGIFLLASQVRRVHFIWSYDWYAQRGASYGDFSARIYSRCTFLSLKGTSITEYPSDGRCGWVRFGTGDNGGQQ